MKKKLSLLAKRYQKLSRLTKIENNKKIIDCACGRGFGSEFILNEFKPEKFVCVDIDKEMIKECRMRTNKKVSEYLCIDLRKFKYDEQFDYFFCVETLEHLPKRDNIMTAKTISSLIEINGKLLISVPGNPKDAMNDPNHLQIVSEEVLLEMFNNFTLENKSLFIKREKEPDSYNSLYIFIKKYN
jgi:2-polyprenyl-3-methyl-5-hydroxy-6-metoxy-1,4-benzoquinol methylase